MSLIKNTACNSFHFRLTLSQQLSGVARPVDVPLSNELQHGLGRLHPDSLVAQLGQLLVGNGGARPRRWHARAQLAVARGSRGWRIARIVRYEDSDDEVGTLQGISLSDI